LKILREPVINQLTRKYNLNKELSVDEKIEELIKEGISFQTLLEYDIHKKGATLTDKKKELNRLAEKGLNIGSLKGNTLDEKINSLIGYFESVEKDDNINIALDGYEKMLVHLNTTLPKLNKQLRDHFEIQDEFILKAELLLDYNIKPR